MKNAGWVCAGFLAAFLVMGASGGYECGRFKLVKLECEREFYHFDQELPTKVEKVSRCFKVDSDTGQVWIFKDEIHEIPNNKFRLKQYFKQLPYEEILPEG